jgi:ketosteroid isomerase-like protein
MNKFKLNDFFNATDSMNSQRFKDFFQSDASWFFGNSDPLVGSIEIKEMADNFFKTLKSIKHNIEKNLRSGDTVFLEGKVRYFRHDESIIELPFACSIELLEEKIKTYKTYIDLAPLIAFETRI